MHRPLDTVRSFIGDEELIERGGSVLVGLSGGVDSVVLTDMLHRLGFEVSALHVNYRLRGQASDEDERFVRSFCVRLGLDLQVRSYDTSSVAGERQTSVQETARDLRYHAFEEAAREAGISKVAVGHHRDDQAETVLLHLFRGSGPEGLAGMPVQRALHTGSDVTLVRPLLCLRRSNVEEYAIERGLDWREDESNAKSAYRRGAIRSQIVPLIEKHFGAGASENIVRSAELMRAYVENGLAQDIREAFAVASRIGAAAEHAPDILGSLDVSALRTLDPVLRGRVVLEAIRRWLPALGATRTSVAEIEALLDAQPGRRLVHPTGVVWRERERLLFKAAANAEEETGVDAERVRGSVPPIDESAVLTNARPATTRFGTVELTMNVSPPPQFARAARHDEYVDADRLAAPLVVRPWRAGDRFVPLGMQHTKKISDFLTDEKVPSHQRDDVLVVQSGDEIVWVVGRRIAHTVRVRPETLHVARLRFNPTENTSTTSA